MSRELLLLRHGQAQDDPPDGSGDDLKRELTSEGKRDAQRVGVWLASNDLLPDYVVSSTAARAVETAKKLCKAAGLDADSVQCDERLYGASLQVLLSIIQAVPISFRRLLVVGHNPGLEAFVGRLCPGYERGPVMPPGALAHLAIADGWTGAGSAPLDCVELVLPDRLPRDFPFPGPDGPERRPRPAYYYRQSSVIPYRYNGDSLEVLIVSSSKRKHGVIPKGIHDPGKTAQESAAREALEEAGVLGDVRDTVVGTYGYAKWGANCTVTVYPMSVTQELPEEEWEERHRGRKWLPVETAAKEVKNVDVRRLIAKLPDALRTTHQASAAVGPTAIFLRHGDYQQLSDTPSAHQPFPLNERGEGQARSAISLVRDMVHEHGWSLHPVIHSSTLLRAWQTAQALVEGLESPVTLVTTDELAERGVGSAANLSRTQIAEMVKRDPRFPELPADWKTDSHFKLPFIGAESLMEAGRRVAEYVQGVMDEFQGEQNVAVLFVGHGGSFRHAAHHLGVLSFEEIAGLSMHHARPVALTRQADGPWRQTAGEWKSRHNETRSGD